MSTKKKYTIGVDIGGTTVKTGLFTVDGELLDKWEIPTRVENNGKNILPDVAASIQGVLLDSKIDKNEIAGVGIGVPGPVDDKGVVPFAVNLHWGNVDVAGEMKALLGLHTRATNDANAAALGELWKGGGSGYHNLILVTIGTGIGGGIIVNENIISGSHGAAGEIGHAHVEDEMTEPCNCGNCGCLEQMVSATGLVRMTKRELEESETPSVLRGVEISAKVLWDAVKAKDELAMHIADKFGRYLGKALASFACVVDPDVIVVGGGVSRAGSVLLDYIGKYYRQYAFAACKNTAFALADLGNDAGIYGAAKLVM